MADVINVVRGDEWVFPASLKADGTLVSVIGDYTITAEVIRASDGAVLLSLTEGNGRVEIGETAADITFRIPETETVEGAANPIPLGQLSKFRFTVVDSAGKTTKTSCWLNVQRDGGEDTVNDITLNFSTSNVTLNFTSAEGPAGPGSTRASLGLATTDSPTFAGLELTGGATIGGKVQVNDPTSVTTGPVLRLDVGNNSDPIAFGDGTLVLNGNVGDPPLAGQRHTVSLVLVAPDNAAPTVEFNSYGVQSSVIGYTAKGTKASPLPVTKDMLMMRVNSRGYDGEDYWYGAGLTFYAAEDFGENAHGGYAVMAAVPNGFSRIEKGLEEGTRFQPSGGVSIGNSTFNATDPTNGVLALLTGLQTPKIFPVVDSATAIQITKADKTTPVASFDTTNVRMGIGTDAPSSSINVVAATNAGLRMQFSDATSSAFIGLNDGGNGGNLLYRGSGGTGANIVQIPSSFSLYAQGAGGLSIGNTTSTPIRFFTGGAALTSVRAQLHSSGGFALGDSTFNATDPGAGNMRLQGFYAGVEMTAPSAPAADGFRMWAEDNGSGKTRLMVKFQSGAAQQIAIEP